MKAFGERMVTREMRGQGSDPRHETRSPDAGLGRRGFLGALFGTAASAVVDPERLLWKPGKLISIPGIAPDTSVVMMTETIRITEFRRRYIDSAALALADSIDREIRNTIDYRWSIGRAIRP